MQENTRRRLKVFSAIITTVLSENLNYEKHEVAVMLQLKEILEIIEKNYSFNSDKLGYFALLNRSVFFNYVFSATEGASFTV